MFLEKQKDDPLIISEKGGNASGMEAVSNIQMGPSTSEIFRFQFLVTNFTCFNCFVIHNLCIVLTFDVVYNFVSTYKSLFSLVY